MIYIVVIVLAVVVDRLVKLAVASNMSLGESISIIDNFFHITYIRNTGAAFSLFSEHTWILSVFTAIIIVVGIVFLVLKRNTASKMMLFAISIIIGGGIGNLIDRFYFRYVIDMFDFRVFAIFNVADIFVCVGCLLLCIDVIFMEKRNGIK